MDQKWTLPGTTLEVLRSEADRTEEMFQPMFLAGGLTLSQVANITGLEPYAIQNWVKRGYLPSPRNKRYDMEQLCRIMIINMLKGCLQLEQICNLISYINGNLADESDDIIDDTQLYFKFVSLAARARYIGGTKEWGEALEEVLKDYREPYPHAREKILQVLRIMLTAWVNTRLKVQIDQMITDLA